MSIAAFDIGGTNVKWGLFGGGEAALEHGLWPTEAIRGPHHYFDRIIRQVRDIEGVKAVGISLTGQIDVRTGVVLYATESMPGLTSFDVRGYLQSALGLPVYVENDANCVAIGEHAYGAAKNRDNFICLTYGTGIGGALFIDGALYRGSTFCAGEFGHIPIFEGDTICSCGRIGCYETRASALALRRAVRQTTGADIDCEEILREARRPNSPLQPIVESWIADVVQGLIVLTHLLNPCAILLGGGIMENKHISCRVSSLVRQQVFPTMSQLDIRPCELGNRAGLLGALHLALQYDVSLGTPS